MPSFEVLENLQAEVERLESRRDFYDNLITGLEGSRKQGEIPTESEVQKIGDWKNLRDQFAAQIPAAKEAVRAAST